MDKFEEMTESEKRELYDATLRNGVLYCCDYHSVPFEKMNGICPDCGRATCDGKCVCGCKHSPVECKTCGASPCDCSC